VTDLDLIIAGKIQSMQERQKADHFKSPNCLNCFAFCLRPKFPNAWFQVRRHEIHLRHTLGIRRSSLLLKDIHNVTGDFFHQTRALFEIMSHAKFEKEGNALAACKIMALLWCSQGKGSGVCTTSSFLKARSQGAELPEDRTLARTG
jgi:hypothetical protein